jgi:hypothetical protein
LRSVVHVLTTTDTKRRVLGVDVLLLILKVLVGHVEGCVEADEGADGAGLEGGKLLLEGCQMRAQSNGVEGAYGLARLLAEQVCELIHVLAEELNELSEELLALLDGGVPPGGEGLLCGGDSIVQVLVAANWHIPEFLTSGRVDAVVDLVRATLLAIDDVVELLEVESGDLSRRHVCGV